MLRCYRFRVYPTRRERRELDRQMLLAKELYNLILEKAKCHYEETGKTFARNMMNPGTVYRKRPVGNPRL
jgi:hypothetical protein